MRVNVYLRVALGQRCFISGMVALCKTPNEKLTSKVAQTIPYVLVETRCYLYFSMALPVLDMEKLRYQKTISLIEDAHKKLAPMVSPVSGSYVDG